MGRIVVTEFISLDGVIEAPGGGEDYKYGGWTFEIDRGDKGNQFKLDETMKSAALLLGRRTYEGFARRGPNVTGRSPTSSIRCRSTSCPRRCATRSGPTRLSCPATWSPRSQN